VAAKRREPRRGDLLGGEQSRRFCRQLKIHASTVTSRRPQLQAPRRDGPAPRTYCGLGTGAVWITACAVRVSFLSPSPVNAE
jgi:hypothetical protein